MDKLMRQVLDEIIRLSEPKPNRRYEEYEELVELRQRLVDQVEENVHLLSEEQRGYIRQILSYDAVILKHMAMYKREAEEGLLAIEAGKRQRRTYEMQNFDGGILFDKKK
jgi:regulator of replication initiation timing